MRWALILLIGLFIVGPMEGAEAADKEVSPPRQSINDWINTFSVDKMISDYLDNRLWPDQAAGGKRDIEPQKLNDESPRKEYIKWLTKETIEERYYLLKQGVFDGSGLLYQSMTSYLKLLKFCSKKELQEIHEAVSPGHHYVAAPK